MDYYSSPNFTLCFADTWIHGWAHKVYSHELALIRMHMIHSMLIHRGYPTMSTMFARGMMICNDARKMARPNLGENVALEKAETPYINDSKYMKKTAVS